MLSMHIINTRPKIPISNKRKKIGIIGGGVIGMTTAWYLSSLGHEIVLIDTGLKKELDPSIARNGTTASLGVLMGYVFRRASGRGWKLRKRSMELWKEWITQLNTNEYPLKIEKPLVQLAGTKEEALFMQKLIQEKSSYGIEPLNKESMIGFHRSWPKNNFGGLISHEDGRLDPIKLRESLLNALNIDNVKKIRESVLQIERNLSANNRKWSLHLSSGETIKTEIVIICAALGSNSLLQPLGYSRPTEPILGQVLELQLNDELDWSGWPAVLVSEGLNLIPFQRNQIRLGASIEQGKRASSAIRKEMLTMNGKAPNWMRNALITNYWSGLRAKPIERYAPLLEVLEEGLIISTGHYRNGVLLAPASAEWVANQING